jgi:hypothetical protein
LWFQRVGNDGSDDLFNSVQAGVSGQLFSVGQEPVAITLKSKEVVYGTDTLPTITITTTITITITITLESKEVVYDTDTYFSNPTTPCETP